MSLQQDLLAEIRRLPVIDVHSHLPHERPQAQSPAEVLLYHVFATELMGAGMPRETMQRLQGTPGADDFAEWIEYWRRCRTTTLGRVTWQAVRDLWGAAAEPSVEALQDLWRRAGETAAQPAQATAVFDRCRLVTTAAARSTKPPAPSDARVGWQLERAFWGVDPARSLVEASAKPVTADDFEEQCATWLGSQVEQGANSLATSPPGGDWNDAGPTSLRLALNHLGDAHNLSAPAREALHCAQARALLRCSHETRVPVCFALGVEVVEGWATLAVADDRFFLRWLLLALKEFPRARVLLLESNWSAGQSVCLAARQCPNLYVGGHWWQSLYDTSTLEQMRHRLAAVPMTKVVGFFSDAYAAEWVYARLLLCEEPLAQALAERIMAGRLQEDTAVEIARRWLHDNAAELLAK